MLSIRLRELRKKNKLSQIELGEAVGLSYKTISKYECSANKPDPDTLCRFADYFGVSVDYLLGRIEEDKDNTVKVDIILTEDE